MRCAIILTSKREGEKSVYFTVLSRQSGLNKVVDNSLYHTLALITTKNDYTQVALVH